MRAGWLAETVAGAAVGLVVAGCGAAGSAPADGADLAGEPGITVLPGDQRAPAPAVSGPTVDGGRVALSDFSGRPVVVNVWFADCPPCRAEADDLVAAERKLDDGPGPGVAFLGINIRDDPGGAAAFQRAFHVDWPSIFDPSGAQLLGFRDSLPSAAVPTTWVVDSRGRVGARIAAEITSPTTLVEVVREVERAGRAGG